MQLQYLPLAYLQIQPKDVPEHMPTPKEPRWPFSGNLTDYMRAIGPGMFVGRGWKRPMNASPREPGTGFLYFLLVRLPDWGLSWWNKDVETHESKRSSRRWDWMHALSSRACSQIWVLSLISSYIFVSSCKCTCLSVWNAITLDKKLQATIVDWLFPWSACLILSH